MFTKPDHEINERDFNTMFLDCTDMLYSLGLRLFSYKEDKAKDFIQNLYLHSFNKKDSFKGTSKFSTWLYSVALNYGLNELRLSKKELRSMEDLKFELSRFHEGKTEISSSKHLIEEELKAQIQKELLNLPKIHRICLILFYYEGLSYKEMSKKLEIKEGTIKSYIHRGKKLLRGKLKFE